MSWLNEQLASPDVDAAPGVPSMPPARRSSRKRHDRTATSSSTSLYVDFIASAPILDKQLREARQKRRRLGQRKQSTAEYKRLSAEIEQLSAIIQPTRRKPPKKKHNSPRSAA
ncbi:hypothetical protein FE257_005575 [Aspergillus nanangensis]|uniref:Uncharacterized protein n=1 Tax=Aspergillus nanangensis TaxID=2582783 RepID=A0AAD4CQB1_ASPNN|nr:hypothetical protein FE257_005575 [Aspergillus nanangensis]